MRLESYLLTEGRSKSIKPDEAYDIIEKKCWKTARAYYRDDGRIYRGVTENLNALFVDPKSGKERRSRNTSNYYTLLMDNIPAWNKYPKRSRSIICTTKKSRAYSHGMAYAVFPYDGSKIAVAPEKDIWDSFQELGILRSFNDRFDDLFRRVFDANKSTYGDGSDKDWKTLKTSMEKFDDYVKDKGIKNVIIHDFEYSFNYGYPWLRPYDGNLFNTMKKLFDPNKNGFKLTTAGSYLPSKERELWTDGKSVLMNIGDVKRRELLMYKLKEITI